MTERLSPMTDADRAYYGGLGDLTTLAGALSFVEWCKAQMRSTFFALGEFPSPDGYLFATTDLPNIDRAPPGWRPGKPIPSGAKLPEAIPLRIPTRAGGPVGVVALGTRQDVAAKDFFATTTRSLASAVGACGVVLLMEMWYMEVAPPEGIAPGEFERPIEGEVKDHPDRKEALFISLEHKASPRALSWIAPIHRNPTRLDEWREKPLEGSQGRLTHLGSREVES